MEKRAGNLSRRVGGRFRRLVVRLHEDRGSAAVSFILAFPIFLTIIAILVQYALLVNAKLMVQHAADAAGRSAMTCLPDQHPEDVRRAATLALVSLSPQAGTSLSGDAIVTRDALTTLGVSLPDTFATRYTYAQEATSVTWNHRNFFSNEGRPTDVTVRYRFLLTVPVARGVLARAGDSVAGVSGRFFTVGATARVQSSHGRGANADGRGWPW